MEDLNKKIELLFSESGITNNVLNNNLKNEFKEQIISLFIDTIFLELAEKDRINLEELIKSEDKKGLHSFMESHPSTQKIISNFWSEKIPSLIQEYKKQVLEK